MATRHISLPVDPVLYPMTIRMARKPGDRVETGQLLAEISVPTGEELNIEAKNPGLIVSLHQKTGTIVEKPGSRLLEYAPHDENGAPAKIGHVLIDDDPAAYPIRLLDVVAKPGQPIAAGTRLWRYENRDGKTFWSEAPFPGTVLAVHVAPGDIFVKPGTCGVDCFKREADTAPPGRAAADGPKTTDSRQGKSTDPYAGLGAFDKMPDGKFVFIARYERRIVGGMALATVVICGAAIFGERGYDRLTDSFHALTALTRVSGSGSGPASDPAGRIASNSTTAKPEIEDADRTKGDINKILASSKGGQMRPTATQQAAFKTWIDG